VEVPYRLSVAMRVGELARRTGVGVSTLRAWERRFQFLLPQRSTAGHRLYDESDVERVDAVVRLVAEGLTLAGAIARVATVGTSALPAGEADTMLYSQVLQAVSEGIWVIRDSRTRYANRRMAELMGCSVDDLVTLPIMDIFEPTDLPLVKERTTQVRAGKRVHFTQSIRRTDGSTFLAEVNTTPLFNQAGRYEGAVALVSDVTARTEAATHTHLRAALLDSIGEAVMATTAGGRVMYVNAAAERLLGWRATDVIGRHSRYLFPADDEAEQIGKLLTTLRKGERYVGRLDMSRHDGSRFDALVTAAPALDVHDELVGFVAVITDETEHERLERAMLKRERQSETVALLGIQAIRQRAKTPGGGARLVLTEAVEATRRLLHADHVAFLDVIEDADELHVRAASPPIDERISLPSGSRSFAGYTALARKVVFVDDTDLDRRFDRSSMFPGDRAASVIGAPVFGPDGIIGVLIAESSAPSRFDHGDAHFIQGMANIIGTALLV
jgi:PAS domain S-box-containing protein